MRKTTQFFKWQVSKKDFGYFVESVNHYSSIFEKIVKIFPRNRSKSSVHFLNFYQKINVLRFKIVSNGKILKNFDDSFHVLLLDEHQYQTKISILKDHT